MDLLSPKLEVSICDQIIIYAKIEPERKFDSRFENHLHRNQII